MKICWCFPALLAFLFVYPGSSRPAIAQSTSSPSGSPQLAIIDTDIGDDIDDALALSLALQSPELKILGISTVLQDGPRRADLVWRILQLHRHSDIPIGIGAERPLMAAPRTGAVRQ